MGVVVPMGEGAERLVELSLRVPQDRPFTVSEARSVEIRAEDLRELVRRGLLRHPIRGVYSVAGLADTLRHRIAVLALVVPDDCVVTDRTAAWLWGAESALAPNDHATVPQVSVFAPPGRRLRNGLTRSGERMLADRDVAEVENLLVTTPLRTACDVARLLPRDHALAALDGLCAVGGIEVGHLGWELDRFKGYRGIVQARALAPIADPKAASFGESVLRLRWLDAGLPRPECQVEVPAPNGSCFLLDMGLPEERFGAEYDGEAFHGPDREEHDAARRRWIRDHEHWRIVVARRNNVFGRNQDIDLVLQREYRRQRGLRGQKHADPSLS